MFYSNTTGFSNLVVILTFRKRSSVVFGNLAYVLVNTV